MREDAAAEEARVRKKQSPAPGKFSEQRKDEPID
jgi:hypothetical protein